MNTISLALSSPTSIWLDSQKHTSYLSFLLHGQDFWVNICSTQMWVIRDKMNFASKQRKSRQNSIHCKFVMWSKVWYKEQFVIDPHPQFLHMTNNFVMWSKIACHVKQFCSTWPSTFLCGAKLLHMTFFAPRTMSAASATNMMYALENSWKYSF